jgi:hypothetical protein
MVMDCYEFRAKSHLGSGCTITLEEYTLRHDPSGETVLIGCVADQTALHGALMKIRDVGLQLVAVVQVDPN